jgi:hypothetical protein
LRSPIMSDHYSFLRRERAFRTQLMAALTV